MLKSMTGFGRYEETTENYKICVEMKAVNHRYLDLGIKMPRKLNAFESALRGLLKNEIQRGKVDVYITYEDYSAQSASLKYNAALAAEYMEAFRRMEEQFGIVNDMTVSALGRCPEVLSMASAEADEEELWKIVSEAVSAARDRFVASRETEGEQLKTDLLAKLDEMSGRVDEIEERFPQVLAEYRTRLEEKVRELLSDTTYDENRILQEVAVYSDRICVDEEMVRLRSHIHTMRDELQKGGAVGRKLDFIAQEMNREANTTLSKSGDLRLSDAAIALKTEIEKVREQVQNIE
ncbi:MAG: YicC family protein [Lachnospiraceae bacterium]|nr:YicC family protein [Lachnospiraceae bacterium]